MTAAISLVGPSGAYSFYGIVSASAGIYGYNKGANAWVALTDPFSQTTAGHIGTNGSSWLAGRGTSTQQTALATGFGFGSATTPSFTRLNGVFRYGSSFLITYLVAGAAFHSLTSSDGVTFTNDNTLSNFSPRGSTYYGSTALIVGRDGNGLSGRIWYSTDSGVTFSNQSNQPFESGTDVINCAAASSTSFIVAGSNSGSTAGKISRSTAPATSFGAYTTNPITTDIQGIAYANSIYLAGGGSGQMCRSTDDGVSWGSLLTNPFSSATTTVSTIVSDGSIFLAYGSSKYAVSSDGVTWSDLQSTPAAFGSIA
jgi:hypothetical protein